MVPQHSITQSNTMTLVLVSYKFTNKLQEPYHMRYEVMHMKDISHGTTSCWFVGT